MPDLYRTFFFPAISKNPDFLLRKTAKQRSISSIWIQYSRLKEQFIRLKAGGKEG
jgi:hypothetical protein